MQSSKCIINAILICSLICNIYGNIVICVTLRHFSLTSIWFVVRGLNWCIYDYLRRNFALLHTSYFTNITGYIPYLKNTNIDVFHQFHMIFWFIFWAQGGVLQVTPHCPLSASRHFFFLTCCHLLSPPQSGCPPFTAFLLCTSCYLPKWSLSLGASSANRQMVQKCAPSALIMSLSPFYMLTIETWQKINQEDGSPHLFSSQIS